MNPSLPPKVMADASVGPNASSSRLLRSPTPPSTAPVVEPAQAAREEGAANSRRLARERQAAEAARREKAQAIAALRVCVAGQVARAVWEDDALAVRFLLGGLAASAPLLVAAAKDRQQVLRQQAQSQTSAQQAGGAGLAPQCTGCLQAMRVSSFRGGNYRAGWRCDRCKRAPAGDDKEQRARWFCRPCQSDVCFACVPRLAASADPPDAKAAGMTEAAPASQASDDEAALRQAQADVLDLHDPARAPSLNTLLSTRWADCAWPNAFPPDGRRDAGPGLPALTLACLRGSLAAAEALLEAHPHALHAANAQDRRGLSPLMAAALGGHCGLARLLLARGADETARDARGWQPVHFACVWKYPRRESVREFQRAFRPSPSELLRWALPSEALDARKAEVLQMLLASRATKQEAREGSVSASVGSGCKAGEGSEPERVGVGAWLSDCATDQKQTPLALACASGMDVHARVCVEADARGERERGRAERGRASEGERERERD
jgi:hypothetical protein